MQELQRKYLSVTFIFSLYMNCCSNIMHSFYKTGSIVCLGSKSNLIHRDNKLDNKYGRCNKFFKLVCNAISRLSIWCLSSDMGFFLQRKFPKCVQSISGQTYINQRL